MIRVSDDGTEIEDETGTNVGNREIWANPFPGRNGSSVASYHTVTRSDRMDGHSNSHSTTEGGCRRA
jgi:hypothetical protein